MSLHPPPAGGPSSRPSPPAWLYGLVVFAAAWLVFWTQPLAVRGVLPVLGRSLAVWNTAMVFFQSALPPRLTSFLPSSHRCRLQTAPSRPLSRPPNVRARTDHVSDNNPVTDHANTPPSTLIGPLFDLSVARRRLDCPEL